MTIGSRVGSAAAVFLSLCLGFLLIEGLTRVFLPAFDPSGRFEFDHQLEELALGRPDTEARQSKNTGDFDVAVRINRHGLRDTNDISKARPEDLIFIGDSFTWGWGVEEAQRFSSLVEARTGVRSFNLSTPTDIEGYRELLRYALRLGARVGPVILSVCMENDLRLYPPQHQTQEPVATNESGVLAWKPWLERHSAAYLLATTVVHRTAWMNALAVRAGLIVPNFDGMSRNEDAPEIVASSADRLLEIAREQRTLVVLIPSRGLWVGPNREVEDHVHRAMVAALAGRGIDVLDLRTAFEATGRPLALHFANDPHWTPQGHALAAAAIAERLREMGVLAASPAGRRSDGRSHDGGQLR